MEEKALKFMSDHMKGIYRNLNDLEYMHSEFVKLIETQGLKEAPKQELIDRETTKKVAGDIINSLGFKRYTDLYNFIIENDRIVFDPNARESQYRFVIPNYNPIEHILISEKDKDKRTIITLVHEFFHWTNHMENQNNAHYMLGEFISIYFEEYATDYLLNNNLYTEEELDVKCRLRETYNQLSKNYIEKTGRYDPIQEADVLASHYSGYFRHLLGYFLAEWARINNIDPRTMIVFNENIQNFESFEEALNYLGITDLKEVTDTVVDNIKNKKNIKVR